MSTMLPAQLTPESFHRYPPQGQEFCVAHLDLLRELPLILLPSLLREAIEYDWRFPAERRELDQQGIAVRAGHHCAMPAQRHFGLESTVRPSLAFYNTFAEVDALVSALHELPKR